METTSTSRSPRTQLFDRDNSWLQDSTAPRSLPSVCVAMTEVAAAVLSGQRSTTVVVRRLSPQNVARKNPKLPPLIKEATLDEEGSLSSAKDNQAADSSPSSEQCACSERKSYRVKQLEKDLTFVREHNQAILKALHRELDDLKRMNRELQFRIIASIPALAVQSAQCSLSGRTSVKSGYLLATSLVRAVSPHDDAHEYIERLEQDLRRLRCALAESLKANMSLHASFASRGSPRRVSAIRMSSDRPEQLTNPSPQAEDFSETWNEMQRYSAKRKNELRSKSHFLPMVQVQPHIAKPSVG